MCPETVQDLSGSPSVPTCRPLLLLLSRLPGAVGSWDQRASPRRGQALLELPLRTRLARPAPAARLCRPYEVDCKLKKSLRPATCKPYGDTHRATRPLGSRRDSASVALRIRPGRFGSGEATQVNARGDQVLWSPPLPPANTRARTSPVPGSRPLLREPRGCRDSRPE